MTLSHDLDLPDVIELEPTHSCNLRCTMCHVSYEKPEKTILDIGLLNRLKPVRGKWLILGSVYEPTMHPKFIELIDILNGLDMKIELTTNGTLLNSATVDSLAQSNLKNVTISFDGCKKNTFESIRRNANYENTLDRIIGLFNKLHPKRIHLTINNTIMNNNIDEIEGSIRLWEQYNVDHMRIIAMVIRSNDEFHKNQSLVDATDEFYKYLEEASRIVIEEEFKLSVSSPGFYNEMEIKRRYPHNFIDDIVKSDNPHATIPFNVRPYYLSGYYPGMHVDCKSAFKQLRIMHNGDVQLCYQFVIGNLYQNDLEDIWYGEKADKVRRALLRSPKICNSCDYFRFCIRANTIDYKNKNNFYDISILKEAVKYLEPIIVEEYGSYNIVGWNSQFYGLPKSHGKVDFVLDDLSKIKGLRIDSTIMELKQKIVNGMSSE